MQHALKQKLLLQLETCKAPAQAENAEGIIASLLADYPDHADVWAEVASFYSFQKQLDLAVEAMSRAIACAPEEPAYYFNRSKSYLGLGQFQSALQDSRKVVALAAKHEDNYYLTAAEFFSAEALCKLGRYSEAAAIASRLSADAGWWLAYGYRARADILQECAQQGASS